MLVALGQGVFVDMDLVAAIVPEKRVNELRSVDAPVVYVVVLKEPRGSDAFPEVFITAEQCKELIECLQRDNLLKVYIGFENLFVEGGG